MRSRRRDNLKLILFILLISISLGYAFIHTDLVIAGIGKITATSWDIHFNNIQVTTGSVSIQEGDQAATIDTTTKTDITYAVTLKNPGDFYEFTVDVVNSGTLDGMIDIVYSKMDGMTLNELPAYMKYTVTYTDDMPIEEKHLLASGNTETYKVKVEYREDIAPNDIPESIQTKTFSFGVVYIQANETAIEKPTPPTIQTTSYTDVTTFRSDTYREKIKTITLGNEINPPEDVVESWDIGVDQNGNVMAYITVNADDDTMYDLYIQGDRYLYANPNSSYLFARLTAVDSINNLDVLNTSKVTNMGYMFRDTGHDSAVFTLDLGDHFDTSHVTNMSNMFFYTGYSSTIFTLDLGDHFYTSGVTSMQSMFENTGYSSTVFTLDLGDKFNTSEVTNMQGMFGNAGYSSSVFTLNLGNKFDTSKVENMSYMFRRTGYNSTVFTLDLGNKFNTFSVVNMHQMFQSAGYNSPVFTLDLGDKFDTSSVENMAGMFNSTGYNSLVFTMDLGDKFDTSKAEVMNHKFNQMGYSSPVFTLNLGDKFATSEAVSMQSMFDKTGYTSSVFALDLGDKFNTSAVTNMKNMFLHAGHSSPIFTLDLGDHFDTSQVVNMDSMLAYVGYSNPNFTLDLGNYFSTSQVTSMNSMFYFYAYANVNAELDLSSFDFSNVTSYSHIFDTFKSTNKIWVGNATARDWIINNGGNNALTSSNVLIKGA